MAITQYANAQQGVIPDNSILCPEGHDCHCIPAIGNYVDTTLVFVLIMDVQKEQAYIILK
ncbi:MAG: hypothetical protein H0W19_07970 [Nitrosopumilus sp.]|nr:hypothetical protein [Nitrosopumilus sp.]